MAVLYITEFPKQAHQWAGDEAIAAPHAEDGKYIEQTPLAVGAETKSAAFNGATRLIRVHTDAICSIAIGSNPTATTNHMRLAANQTEYFGVKPGEKLSVIANV